MASPALHQEPVLSVTRQSGDGGGMYPFTQSGCRCIQLPMYRDPDEVDGLWQGG